MNARATRRPRGGAGRGPKLSKSGGRGGKTPGGGCALFLIAVASAPAAMWWLVTR